MFVDTVLLLHMSCFLFLHSLFLSSWLAYFVNPSIILFPSKYLYITFVFTNFINNSIELHSYFISYFTNMLPLTLHGFHTVLFLHKCDIRVQQADVKPFDSDNSLNNTNLFLRIAKSISLSVRREGHLPYFYFFIVLDA